MDEIIINIPAKTFTSINDINRRCKKIKYDWEECCDYISRGNWVTCTIIILWIKKKDNAKNNKPTSNFIEYIRKLETVYQ